MIIKVKDSDGKRLSVNTCDSKCGKRDCFQLGQDKGPFVQGRGYTSYYEKPLWVCMRRHLRGCPSAGVCPNCHSSFLSLQKICSICGQGLEPGGKPGRPM
jgi:hypothetical protein